MVKGDERYPENSNARQGGINGAEGAEQDAVGAEGREREHLLEFKLLGAGT